MPLVQTMKENKQRLIDQAKEVLKERLHLVEEKAHGHLRVNGCDFWATTGSWYDPINKVKGIGLRDFISHIESKQVNQ